MGLEIVELVMSIEERFGIDIPDREAELLTSTRKVVDHVFSRVANQTWQPCPTQHAFHRLRRAAPALPERLRPKTSLATLCPSRDRRNRWRALGDATDLPGWPTLRRPAWLVWSGTAVSLATAAATGVAAGSLAIGLLACPWSCWFTARATRSAATRFPRGMVTVRDLLQDIADHWLPPAAGWTRESVRAAVRATVCEQLGLPPDFDDDAEFVGDLGLE